MKKTIQITAGLFSMLTLCFTLKVQAQCDLHNSIDISGHVLKSHLTLYAYQWVRCPDYTPIPGAYAQSYYVTTDGDYALIGTLDTCTDTTECVSITGLGIGNTIVPDEISIFPVPSKDGRISISGKEIYSDAGVQVVDLVGSTKWMGRVNFDQGQAQLNLQLPAGIYFMMIDDKKDTYRKRLKIILE